MKATLDIPDELYRRVKARSAIEGRPVRAVAVELFEHWVESPPVLSQTSSLPPVGTERQPTRFDNAAWLDIAQRYIKPGMRHDLGEIREAIATGWATEVAAKLNPPDANP
ncbi:hypothetical protein [uncultured Thiocystis sp.]|uniref:hypothetical protein n=1 Tax=uncultured Thiocystis sp. TaxID=1202134 RepID=UPI0025FD5FCA|nr:hypothetical protein [uncultured Thiocystis sp.]